MASPGSVFGKSRSATSKVSKRSRLEKTLHLHVDSDILKAISLQTSLQHLGALWRMQPMKMSLQKLQKVNLKAQSAAGYDMFLSHTWHTSGASKFWSMLLRCHASKFVLGWFVGTVLVIILVLTRTLEWELFDHIDHPVPEGKSPSDVCFPWAPWVTVIGFLGGMISLCTAPYFSCAGSSLCFLDMVCIDQTDSELKERGVYGIGGWLSVSTELRILWSPPYFSRLWCVFELAAYRTANPEGHITFQPVFVENLVLTATCFGFMAQLIDLTERQFPTISGVRAVGITVDCIILVVLIWHLQRRWRQQRSALADLAAFDMDGVSCSDAFDRAFVTSAIEGWYGGLDGFTRYVRGPVREELLERFESLHLPFSFYNAMVLPFLGLYIDYALAMQMAEGHSTKEEVASHFFSKGLPRYFCLLICVKLSFDLAHRYAHRRQTTWVDLKATVAITMIFTVMNLTTQTLAPICYDAGLGASLATASVHGLAALLVYALPHLLRRRAGASEAEPEELPAAS
ncbi:Putative serine/threonine-protein kinase [Durusdinium trenchii]|uniref:Serine/threonine-protein kinase n=1 Tax=Durusdinium trenchii TaxID=1381693 RepID=A0ABP0N766_9DINO